MAVIHHIGVAGCGAMGQPMAQRLLGAGFRISAFDVRPLAEFGAFARHMSASPAPLAACDCVLSVVRDAVQTEALCFTEQALFAEPPYPPLLVLCSTLSPRTVAAVRARLPADVDLVDAPMSGAPCGARNGTLTFMLGGEAGVLERLQPVLAAMGARHFHLGPLGAGMTVKVLNNYVAASNVVATRRAMALAADAGVEAARLRAVMRRCSGANWYADNFDQIDWAHEGYAPANTIGILEKDVLCALDIDGGTRAHADDALLAALRRLRQLPPD